VGDATDDASAEEEEDDDDEGEGELEDRARRPTSPATRRAAATAATITPARAPVERPDDADDVPVLDDGASWDWMLLGESFPSWGEAGGSSSSPSEGGGGGGVATGPVGGGVLTLTTGMLNPYGMLMPGYGMLRPGRGMLRPGYGMLRPGYGMLRPGSGMLKPGSGMLMTLSTLPDPSPNSWRNMLQKTPSRSKGESKGQNANWERPFFAGTYARLSSARRFRSSSASRSRTRLLARLVLLLVLPPTARWLRRADAPGRSDAARRLAAAAVAVTERAENFIVERERLGNCLMEMNSVETSRIMKMRQNCERGGVQERSR
jgi:hypothetical protein